MILGLKGLKQLDDKICSFAAKLRRWENTWLCHVSDAQGRHIHTYACMHMHEYIYTCMHACMHAYIHTYMLAYLATYLPTCLFSSIRRYIYIYIDRRCVQHVFLYRQMYINKHVCVCICAYNNLLSPEPEFLRCFCCSRSTPAVKAFLHGACWPRACRPLRADHRGSGLAG